VATGTRRTTAERRQEIARAALRIIGERGLTSLRTTAIAAEVGLTSGALFRHFASIDAILTEAARYAAGRIDETFPDPSSPPLERLEALARGRVELLTSEPGIAWCLRSEQARLTLPEEAVTLLASCAERTRRFVLQALRDGVSRGEIRCDIEPELLLPPVMGTIHVLAGTAGFQKLAARAAARNHRRALRALMRLLAPPSGASRDRKRMR